MPKTNCRLEHNFFFHFKTYIFQKNFPPWRLLNDREELSLSLSAPPSFFLCFQSNQFHSNTHTHTHRAGPCHRNLGMPAREQKYLFLLIDRQQTAFHPVPLHRSIHFCRVNDQISLKGCYGNRWVRGGRISHGIRGVFNQLIGQSNRK